MTQTVTVSSRGFDDDVVITEIMVREVPGQDALEYQITAVDGVNFTTWQEG